MTRRRRPAGVRLRGAAALVTLALCAVLVGVPGSSASFTAKVVNTTDTVGTTAYFTCAAALVGDAAYYAYPLDDATPTNLSSARDVSGSSRTGTYRSTAAHSGSSACTRDGGGSTTFNGSSTYVSTPNLITNPQTFSLEAWFRTSTASGALIGFSSSLLAVVPLTWDRAVYLTSGGKLTFAVNPGVAVAITSTSGYADGAWHHMVATLGPSGMFLYVDGAQAASSTNTTAQVYSGYWHVAYTYLFGLPSVVGTNYYFNGQLGYTAVYTTQLSASTVAAHYRAGT